LGIPEIILKNVREKGHITVSEIVQKTGYSQPYINRFFTKLAEEGSIIKSGKGKNTVYVPAGKNIFKNILKYSARLKNKNLSESEVLESIKKQTGIFSRISQKLNSLISYSFTEMLNNAIEHSNSEYIKVTIERIRGVIKFEITDYGIGIFNNIRKKYKLYNDFDAINELLKGKRTTMPDKHSGEGIFFTSKAADVFIIQSSGKKILFNNIIEDIFLSETRLKKGTKINFSVSDKSVRSIKKIFDEYTDDEFRFSKTKIFVKLYKISDEFISRSQARRILYGLSEFTTITLDFRNVKFAGQGFADEIFRVYKRMNPKTTIRYVNANKEVEFMIKRALS
jgi:anti-sigma regulatory factor (Ser/Thr protein kinase)